MTETVLSFDTLVKRFSKQAVLNGITATVNRGDVIGLLGLNGAGKTTLLDCALGFSLPDAGHSHIFGQDCATLDRGARTRIGFVPQRDELLDAMTTTQYLALIASFYPHWNQALVQRLLLEWDLPADKRIGTQSIGQRQKLSIISALGHEPDLLVLDEPVASLDPVARRLFLTELVDIASSHTRSIVFSTHIVSDLERIANRVWLLQDGTIAIDSELDTLKERVVRIQLPAGVAIPTQWVPLILRQRQAHGGTILLCHAWQEHLAQNLPSGMDQQALLERLSLEEIFLELHA